MIAALDSTRLELASVLSLVDAAADARCDAIKLSSLDWSSCSQVFEHAERRGLSVLVTARDEGAVERLDWLGAPAIELFYDWSDLDLVACAARTGKPIVLSIANASAADVAEAVDLAQREGTGGVALIQRVLDGSSVDLSHLQRHDAVFGISDRTAHPSVVKLALHAGASIVERRVGPRFDLADVSWMVRDCEATWALLGNFQEDFAVN